MKKLLALVLALVMVMGLATVGTSAAFADAADIEHKEAVEVLNALGVIGGRENNNYDPASNVKRSEMAKMVTIAVLGDVDVSAFQGAQTDLTDIDGHWAEGYMKYCYSQGIIGGRGNGKFDPDANVTATEAAKMLLVAIGYNADVQIYSGDQWKVNVVRDAQLSHFYTDLEKLTADKALTRDETAQLVYNAMDATLIQKTSSVSRGDGSIRDEYAPYGDGRDLLGQTFRAYSFEGIFTEFDYKDSDKTWDLTVDSTSLNTTQIDPENAFTINRGITNWNTTGGKAVDFEAKQDYTAFYMQRVKVLYQLDKNGNLDGAIGVYSNKSKIVAQGVLGQIDEPANTDEEVKIDGTIYRLDDAASSTQVYVFEEDAQTVAATLDSIKTTYGAADGKRAIYAFTLIDNDGDNKGNVLVAYPAAIAQVTAVNVNNVTIKYLMTGAWADATKQSFRKTDANLYDGIAKDDFVVYTPATFTATATDTLTKLDSATATVSAIRSGSATTPSKAQVDGNWLDIRLLSARPSAGDKITYVAYHGFMVYQKGASANLEDYVIVKASASAFSNKVDSTIATKLVDGNGTTKTVEVAKINGNAVPAAALKVGTLYMARVNNDGNYELWDVYSDYVYDVNTPATGDVFQSGLDGLKFNPDSAHATYGTATDVAGASYTPAANGIPGRVTISNERYTIADDAAVFVYTTTDSSVAVKTGKALADNAVTGNTYAVKFVGYDEGDDGFKTVKVLYLSTTGALASKSVYAFTVKDPVINEVNGKYTTTLTVWDGTKVTELVTESKSTKSGIVTKAYNLGNKTAFSYTTNASGAVTDVDSGTAAFGNINADQYSTVTGYTEQKMIAVTSYSWARDSVGTPVLVGDGAQVYTYDITKDTEIFYVDLSDTEPTGSTTGTVSLASNWEDDNDVVLPLANVVVLVSGTDSAEAALIVVETNGDIRGVR